MGDDGGLVVRIARLDEVRDLQQAVLRPHGPLPNDRPPPPGMLALGAFEDGLAIGSANIVEAPWPGPSTLLGPTWQLRGMAVRANRQGLGVGRLVLDLAVATAQERGAATLWAEARVEALPFYLRAGWTVVGAEWFKPGIGPHRWIQLPLGLGDP